MTLPPVTVVIPFSRPWRAGHVLQAIKSQDYVGRVTALFVENGVAVGTIAPSRGVTVIRSGGSHWEARNAGLDWVRANGGGAWAMFDDDDWYGPRYLESQIAAAMAAGADVVGKPWEYVMFGDGLWRLPSWRELAWDVTGGLTGGTLAGVHTSLPRFRDRADDDVQFCRDCRTEGLRVWGTSRYHYCYDRSGPGPRVYDGAPAIVRRALIPGVESEYYGRLPHSAVDDVLLRPIARRPPPTQAEIFGAM